MERAALSPAIIKPSASHFTPFPTQQSFQCPQLLLESGALMGQCVSKHPTNGDVLEQEVYLAGGNVELITNKDDWDKKLDEAKTDGRLVIANFSAVWCSPCENIVPFYCNLSVKYPFIMFLTVDVDELSDFSSSMDIKATPTFLILKDGELIHKLVGANKSELQKKIDSLVSSSPLRAL